MQDMSEEPQLGELDSRERGKDERIRVETVRSKVKICMLLIYIDYGISLIFSGYIRLYWGSYFYTLFSSIRDMFL